MPSSVRVSVTLPADLAATLGEVAKRMRITRSALLALLLQEPLQELSKLAAFLPLGDAKTVPADDVRRLRGASIEALQRVVSEALEVARELDPEAKLDL